MNNVGIVRGRQIRMTVVQGRSQTALVQQIFHCLDPDGLVWLKAREDWMPVLSKKDVDSMAQSVAE